jgi:hypothetical protein
MLSSKALGKRRAMDNDFDKPKARALKQSRKSPTDIACAWEPVSDEMEAASLALARRLQAEEDALAQREWERQARMQEDEVRFGNSFDAYGPFGEQLRGEVYDDHSRADDPSITNAMITDALDDFDMRIDCEAYDPGANAACRSKYFAPGKATWHDATRPAQPWWTPPFERVMEVRYGPSSESTAPSECSIVEMEQTVRDDASDVPFPPLGPVALFFD